MKRDMYMFCEKEKERRKQGFRSVQLNLRRAQKHIERAAALEVQRDADVTSCGRGCTATDREGVGRSSGSAFPGFCPLPSNLRQPFWEGGKISRGTNRR